MLLLSSFVETAFAEIKMNILTCAPVGCGHCCAMCSHKWIVGEWTPCRTRLNCGRGLQNRTVLCVRVYGDTYLLTASFLMLCPVQHSCNILLLPVGS